MSETAALPLAVTSVDEIIQDVKELNVAADVTEQNDKGGVPELTDTKLQRSKSHFRKRYHHRRRYSFIGTAAEVATKEGNNKLPLDFISAEKENTAPVDNVEFVQDVAVKVSDSPDEPVSLASSKLENKKKKNGYYFRRRKSQYKKKELKLKAEAKVGVSGAESVPSDVVIPEVAPDEDKTQPLSASVPSDVVISEVAPDEDKTQLLSVSVEDNSA